MTLPVLQWLDERAAGVPPVLMERILAVIASLGDAGEGTSADQEMQALSRAITVQLHRMRDQECTDRRDALDLLTVDALITYVLELAVALKPETLDEYAVDLMRLIGNVEHPRPHPATTPIA